MDLFGLGSFVWWLLIIELFAFSILPYLAWMCPQAPDRGYGLSKLMGPFLFGGTLWLCTLCGISPEGRTLPAFLGLLLVLIGYRGYVSGIFSFAEAGKIIRQYGVSVESIFLGVTGVYAAIRFFNPEIFWGEKPMDSTLLNFFLRNNELPPQDPWASGSLMSYYYLGLFFISALLKVTGLPTAVGFNFAVATLAGWIGCALFSLCLLLTKNRRYSFWCAWLLLFASNPEVFRLVLVNLYSGVQFSFDSVFWPSTRVFTPPGFLEYTSWSLLFADLHAHVIAIPFTVTALALASMVSLDPVSRYTVRGFSLRVLLGLVVGGIFGCNTWDFISFGGVVGVLLISARVPLFWDPPTEGSGKPYLGEVILAVGFARLIALVWDLAVFGLATGLTVWIYTKGASFNPQGSWGWAGSAEFNSTVIIVRVIGYWLIGSLVVAGCLLWGFLQAGYRLSTAHKLCMVVSGAIAFVPALSSVLTGHQMLPWGIFLICALICSIAGGVLLLAKDHNYEIKVLAIFLGAFSVLICIVEVFFLLDRMNTLFKGYMAVWMLSGIATVVGAYYAYEFLKRYSSQAYIRGTQIVVTILVTAILIGTSVNVYAIVIKKRVPVRHYTLDGLAYLRDMNPDDADLIQWINTNVAGVATIVEAQGAGYREFTRITMHTGMSTVLGWEHHAKQRGLPPRSALERRKAIQTIYVSDSIEETRSTLLRYRVDFVVVGAIEKNTYRSLTEDKFALHPELFTKVASFGDSSLYVTYFSKYNPIYKNGKIS